MEPKSPKKEENQKRKIEEIIVLYDIKDQGKTSCLRELIHILTNSQLPSKGDIRVIVKGYRAKNQRKKVNIFIATCGDIPPVIEDNIRFFRGKMPDSAPTPIYVYENGEWKSEENLGILKNIHADICISACRTTGGGVGALQYFMQLNLTHTFASTWIRLNKLRTKLRVPRTKRSEPNWNKVANELKQLIDSRFARNYI